MNDTQGLTIFELQRLYFYTEKAQLAKTAKESGNYTNAVEKLILKGMGRGNKPS